MFVFDMNFIPTCLVKIVTSFWVIQMQISRVDTMDCGNSCYCSTAQLLSTCTAKVASLDNDKCLRFNPKQFDLDYPPEIVLETGTPGTQISGVQSSFGVINSTWSKITDEDISLVLSNLGTISKTLDNIVSKLDSYKIEIARLAAVTSDFATSEEIESLFETLSKQPQFSQFCLENTTAESKTSKPSIELASTFQVLSIGKDTDIEIDMNQGLFIGPDSVTTSLRLNNDNLETRDVEIYLEMNGQYTVVDLTLQDASNPEDHVFPRLIQQKGSGSDKTIVVLLLDGDDAFVPMSFLEYLDNFGTLIMPQMPNRVEFAAFGDPSLKFKSVSFDCQLDEYHQDFDKCKKVTISQQYSDLWESANCTLLPDKSLCMLCLMQLYQKKRNVDNIEQLCDTHATQSSRASKKVLTICPLPYPKHGTSSSTKPEDWNDYLIKSQNSGLVTVAQECNGQGTTTAYNTPSKSTTQTATNFRPSSGGTKSEPPPISGNTETTHLVNPDDGKSSSSIPWSKGFLYNSDLYPPKIPTNMIMLDYNRSTVYSESKEAETSNASIKYVTHILSVWLLLIIVKIFERTKVRL